MRRWLPELARLPTDWIHHPWNAPQSVLQAAGIELGSNYPLPIVEISAAKARIQEAIVRMWQLESISRAATENGTEEGLGDSSDVAPVDFPGEIQMEIEREPMRTVNGGGAVAHWHEDQMVPTISSIARDDEDEGSVDLRNNRQENRTTAPQRDNNGNGRLHLVNRVMLEDMTESTSESSSGWTGRNGGVVPVWSPPAISGHYMGEEDGSGGGSSFIRRHPSPHQLMNWSQLSHTR